MNPEINKSLLQDLLDQANMSKQNRARATKHFSALLPHLSAMDFKHAEIDCTPRCLRIFLRFPRQMEFHILCPLFKSENRPDLKPGEIIYLHLDYTNYRGANVLPIEKFVAKFVTITNGVKKLRTKKVEPLPLPIHEV